MLRVRLLEGLPDVQSLVGVWAPGSVLEVFDQIYNSGPSIKAKVTVAIHFKVDGKRFEEDILDALAALENLIALLNEARSSVLAAHLPVKSGGIPVTVLGPDRSLAAECCSFGNTRAQPSVAGTVRS